MKPIPLLCTLLCIAFSVPLCAQSKDCSLQVQSVVKAPSKNKADGEIQLTIESDSKDITVFLVNAGVDRAKKPLNNGLATGLKKGFYDFMIVDRKKTCAQQFTVTLKEATK